MADANLVLAVARGLRPPLIFGAIASARAEVNQLVATNQIADRQTLATFIAADQIQSPNSIDVFT